MSDLTPEALEEHIRQANEHWLELTRQGRRSAAKHAWMDFCRLHRERTAAQVELLEKAMGLDVGPLNQ